MTAPHHADCSYALFHHLAAPTVTSSAKSSRSRASRVRSKGKAHRFRNIAACAPAAVHRSPTSSSRDSCSPLLQV
jgi:hypothetical protein